MATKKEDAEKARRAIADFIRVDRLRQIRSKVIDEEKDEKLDDDEKKKSARSNKKEEEDPDSGEKEFSGKGKTQVDLHPKTKQTDDCSEEEISKERAVTEDVENLVELSIGVLTRYINKAKVDAEKHAAAADDAMEKGTSASSGADVKKYVDQEAKHASKADSRLKNVRLANKKKNAKKQSRIDDADSDAWHEKQQSRSTRSGVHYHEEVEQIDELSRGIIKSYIAKASADVADVAKKAGEFAGSDDSSLMKASKKLDKKVESRLTGIATAAGRIHSVSGPQKKVVEDTEHSLEVKFVQQLQEAAMTRGMRAVEFSDGTRAAISPQSARRIVGMYEDLKTDEDRARFIEQVSSNIGAVRAALSFDKNK